MIFHSKHSEGRFVKHGKFYGVGTIGERGQIVIPAEAREAFNLNAGDKLVFFGSGELLLTIKREQVETFLSKMAKKLDTVRKALTEERGETGE